MIIQQQVADFARKNKTFKTTELVSNFSFSRQYANRILQSLIKEGVIVKIGSTRGAFYIHRENFTATSSLPQSTYRQTYKTKNLEEHEVLVKIEHEFPFITLLPENIKSIFDFTFSEMLNNAIEHSLSKKIQIIITKDERFLRFTISDSGVGVFKNIMGKKELRNELEAIGELLKGKTTTMPRSHSGEGIFFTSKSVDSFVLESFTKKLTITRSPKDTLIENKKSNKGTVVSCSLSLTSSGHLSDIFRQYTNLTEESDHGFDKTEILIKLYTTGGVHISRSQARRILSGLEKFSIVVFDFDKVPMAGQAFADEIFRVFHNKYPLIQLETRNMNENVTFMITRAISEATRADREAI